MDLQGCGCDKFDGPLALAAPERNHYFYGKLLDEQHITMEQRYFNQKRWLLNRLTVGGGVLCGLGLKATADGHLAVAPGAALDGRGREVLVPVTALIDPRQLTDACGKPTGPAAAGPVTLSLAYHPCAAELVPVMVPDCGAGPRCAMGTVRESFAILVRQGGPPAPAPGWPPIDLFQPPSGQPRVKREDLIAQVVAAVTAASPDVPQATDASVVLARVNIPADPKTAVTDADVAYLGRSVLLGQAVLFQMLLDLWERVEQGFAAAIGPGGAKA